MSAPQHPGGGHVEVECFVGLWMTFVCGRYTGRLNELETKVRTAERNVAKLAKIAAEEEAGRRAQATAATAAAAAAATPTAVEGGSLGEVGPALAGEEKDVPPRDADSEGSVEGSGTARVPVLAHRRPRRGPDT